MRPGRWWHWGLIGGTTLSLATSAKAVGATVVGRDIAGMRLVDAVGFAAAIFGMGFVCGSVAWAARGLSRRFGRAGDAAVGLAVMVVFFVCCMLLFDAALLGSKFTNGGLPMLGLAALLGPFGGVLVGRDLRRGVGNPRTIRPRDPHDTPFRDS